MICLISLTKDADELICLAYHEYLVRLNLGQSQRQARNFVNPLAHPDSIKKRFHPDDLPQVVLELKNAKLVKSYIRGGFELESGGIRYMEQRFANNVSDVLEWLGKIRSAIPFV